MADCPAGIRKGAGAWLSLPAGCRAALCGLLLAAVALGWAWYHRVSEPRHEGRTMAEWVEFSIHPWDPAPATAATRVLGTNALPGLIRILEQEESRMDVLLDLCWRHLPSPIQDRTPPPTRLHLHRQVMTVKCVAALGSNGADAVPALTRLLETAELNQEIHQTLQGMGPAAAAAAPSLVAWVQRHPDWLYLEQVWAVFWSIGPAATNAFGTLRLESDPRSVLVGNAGGLWFTGQTNAALQLLQDAAFRAESGTRSEGRSDAEATGDLAASILSGGIGPALEALAPVLLDRLQQDAKPLWRERAATVLGGLQKTPAAAGAAAALGAALRRESEAGALRAELMALAQLAIPDPTLTPVLEKFLQGSDEETIRLARVALVVVGGATGAPTPAMP